MPRVGFEPTISAGERPQTYALDRTATGTGWIKNLEAITGKLSTYSLQKTATVPRTSQIIQKVLLSENWNLSGGDHRWFKRSTGEKRLMRGGMMKMMVMKTKMMVTEYKKKHNVVLFSSLQVIFSENHRNSSPISSWERGRVSLKLLTHDGTD